NQGVRMNAAEALENTGEVLGGNAGLFDMISALLIEFRHEGVLVRMHAGEALRKIGGNAVVDQ
ncbi:unnamed protein product, partial [Didymodactylos carnosus]